MSVLFIILAAICNAIMDTLTHHYSKSVFKSLDSTFWNPYISWKNKYVDWDNGDKRVKKFVQLSDAWHIFKTLMIVFICFSVASFPLMPSICLFPYLFLNYLLWVLILGVCWNVSFSLFYSKVLQKQ